ncbi:MAG: hypothetical protein COA80_19135 [Leeuwenhoekiella sp.]|nr:MAG: hypothetical protein COA80_19135 [Leeuwenhoekiella sp.]
MIENEEAAIDNLLKELEKVDFDVICDYNGLTYVFDVSENPELENAIKKLFICEILPAGKIEFKKTATKYPDLLVYKNEYEFITTCKITLSEYDKYSILFLNPQSRIDRANLAYSDTSQFVINFLNYRAILDLFFKTKDISQLNNPSTQTITMVSKEYGIFNIGYSLPNYKFFYNINISGKLNQLLNEFEKKEFIQFFKEIIVTSVHRIEEKDRFRVIIEQIDPIIDLTSKDYEAYVSDFAIDKIKSEFKKERESYFESIDRSISSIGKQVVAFPLTFAASVFASYKVQDKPGVLLLILLAYLLYTIVAYLVLSLTSYNIRCLRKDVETEKGIIQNAYGKVYENFKPDFEKIGVKICLLRIVVGFLYVVLTLLFVLFFLYLT